MGGVPLGMEGFGIGSVLGDSLKNNITLLEVGAVPSLGLRTDFAMGRCVFLGQVNQPSCQICQCKL